MAHASSLGVLLLNTDASVRHVDPTAASLLGTDPDRLLDGTAEVLQGPVSTADGSSYRSLQILLDHLVATEASTATIALPTTAHPAEVRVTHGPDGPSGAVLLVSEEPGSLVSEEPGSLVSEETGLAQTGEESAHYVSIPDDVTDRRWTERLREGQSRILERVVMGAPLSETLTSLISFIEEERPGLLGSILLLDAEDQTLHHGTAPSLPDAYVERIDGLQIGPTAGSCGAAAHHGEPVIAEDIETDDRWAEYRAPALEHGLRACWSVPIYGEDDKVLGTFALYHDEPRAPSEAERLLVEEASHIAGIAIEYDRQKQALQLQEDRFQRLVENAQPVIFLLDAEGTVLFSEGEDLSAIGVEPGASTGESIYDLYADHPTLLQYIDRALSGEAVDATVEVNDVVYDAWYAPYYDRTGDVAGCIGMAVDITERRAAEAALRANRDLLRRTQEMAHVGGWAYDPHTDAMVGTEETYRLYELPPDAEFTLEQSMSFYPPDVESALREAATRCLEQGESFTVEGPMTGAEGTRRWVRIRGQARRDDDGTITKMVGTVQDLTERHEMEEQLREQKEWLQSITENISGGIYRSTDDGLVYANQALLDLFGYERLEEMAAAPVESLYVDPDVRQDLIRCESEQGGLDGVEVKYRRKDGSTFTGLLRSTQVTDEDGEVQYYDGVVTDITEQKARERRFRDQRQKIEAMYGPSGRLLHAESREAVAACLVELVRETFGYSGVAVRYAQGGRLVPVPLSPEAPERRPEQPAFRIEGDSVVAETFRAGETRMVDDIRSLNDPFDDGDVRALAGAPLGDHGILTLASVEPGGINTFDLRLINILARKATAVLDRIDREAQLRASESRFRGLFEEAALGIALVNPEGRIVEANSELASMLGVERDALRGCHFSTLTHPDDRETDESLFNELVAGERERYEIEKRYVRRDNTVFWGRVTVSQHKGPGDAEVIGMVEDINSRKEYERQLKEAKQEAEEASRLKSALLANMSHEIRTPLTSIIGFMGVLEDNLSGSNARYARLAHQGGKRLMETLDSVLQLSKLEAGVIEPASEQMDLVERVRQTLDLYWSQAETAEVDLRFVPEVETLRGQWAPTAVQRILSNLLSNAIKFTPAGGTVTVRVRPDDVGAALEVEDTGVGIDEDFRTRIFKAFTQESQGLQREHEGSGLGLAIVNRLVDLLDGRIELESTKGVGSRFTVLLPLNR